MLRRVLLVCIASVALCGSAIPLWADDIFPPPWQRGEPGTTYQAWTFGTNANPSSTDEYTTYNPYGTPEATVTNGTWNLFYDNHVGVWTLGSNSSIDLTIPNSPLDDTSGKDVWTQVTWQADFGGSPLVSVVADGTTYPSLPGESLVEYNGWTTGVYETVLPNNPTAEHVVVKGTMDVGEVVIDTQLVPEPSTFALLAVGVLGLWASLWRRKSVA